LWISGSLSALLAPIHFGGHRPLQPPASGNPILSVVPGKPAR
jgi:hypothetical protein